MLQPVTGKCSAYCMVPGTSRACCQTCQQVLRQPRSNTPCTTAELTLCEVCHTQSGVHQDTGCHRLCDKLVTCAGVTHRASQAPHRLGAK